MAVPAFEEFARKAEQGNLIPVMEEVHYDWETPIAAFRKINDGKCAFLLESVEGGEKWGRFSFLGSGPATIFRSRGGEWEILRDGTLIEKGKERDGLRALQNFLSRFRPVPDADLPRFAGGAVGYIGYDMVRSWERMPETLPPDPDFDDCYFMIADTLLVFDNLRQKIQVISNACVGDGRPLKAAYEEALEKNAGLISRLKTQVPSAPPKTGGSPSPLRANFSREEFMEKVGKARDYIHAGDAIQVVLAQRFSTRVQCDPFDIYRALRSINPSPYLFYLQMGETALLGASPEVMVRLEGKQIDLRPLAGTRRRGRTAEEDRRLEEDLLADEKERAEHIMLVDLGRNDVGRVAEIGSVEVTELMGVERYSHVMHIVSHVRGVLARGKDAYDVLRATFPAGTVSGAPKVRAMEIIEELEPVRRGFYAGAVGYFSFTGNMDTCITIRSILVRDGRATIQAGAGIVADSDPAKEYEETLTKAQAILKAIQKAEEGLP